jgi:hypothetical protein
MLLVDLLIPHMIGVELVPTSHCYVDPTRKACPSLPFFFPFVDLEYVLPVSKSVQQKCRLSVQIEDLPSSLIPLKMP